MRVQEKKYIILGSLCAIILTLTVAYAAFQANLKIKGTSNITSEWNILITNVEEINKGGSAVTTEKEGIVNPSWNGLTANIEADLFQKGDFIEYEVTVENRGTLDAKLNEIKTNTTKEHEAILISFSGYTKGQKLEKGTSHKIIVRIEYNPEFEGIPEIGSKEVNIELEYNQNDDYKKEENGEVSSPDRYLVKYDCTTNGGEKCTNYNEYLKEGETINLTHKGPNKKYDFIGWNTDKDAKEGLKELQMGTEEITLYAIYQGEPIIRSWTSSDTSDFHSSSYKQSIISAEFLDHKNIPENATESWDVSEAQDGSVMAWVIADETDNTKHHLYIGGNSGVIANEDSSSLFERFINTTSIDFNNNFDTSNVTNMYAMFRMRISSGVYQSNLTTLNLSGFDTSNVTNMGDMFAHNFHLTNIKGLEQFDTRKVTNISGMFFNGQSFTELDLSNFNTDKVIDMQGMFGGCTNLEKVNLNSFNTSHVTNMYAMFSGCNKITKINLCLFDTSKVTNMRMMLANTSQLEKVYVGSKWTTANANTSDMWSKSKISSVTQSSNCEVDAEDPATIELATSKTSSTITVVTNASAESGIAKYEYSIDGAEWIESTENFHTFTDLEPNTEYTIKVRITSKVGKQTTSDELKVTTNALAIPTFEEVENEANKEVTIIYPEGCGDTLTCSYQKDEVDWIETQDTNTKITFTESGSVVAKVTDGTNEVTASHTVIYEGNQLEYNGEVQTFTADKDGYYKVELWGASGGSGVQSGGKGAYTSGEIYLNQGDNLYIYIGESGEGKTSATFNGGGSSGGLYNARSGGGATDVRTKEGAWNDATSLNSRIMVAAGGGGSDSFGSGSAGGAGGIIRGSHGGYYRGSGTASYTAATGAKQTVGGTGAIGYLNGGSGTFGIGGSAGVTTGDHGGGGGSGYYGGGSGSYNDSIVGSGAGGSSYISGYAGVNSITSESDRTHTNQTKHYSNKYFINTKMDAGVNSGNGKAKITYLKTPSIKDSTKIKGVRYIKDCINGSSVNASNHWVELQAINKGINVAKDQNITSTVVPSVNYSLNTIIDGEAADSLKYAGFNTGMQCVMVDLGKEYDLEEIVVWHFYDDARAYYNNSTQVAGENEIYRVIRNDSQSENSNGIRIRKDSNLSVKAKNINVGYTKGGTIELSKSKNTINIKATPTTDFTYQGATLVCEDKTTKEITDKSFKISDCEGDITVYPKWKRNNYVWDSSTYKYWHVYNADVVQVNLYYNSSVDQTKFETTAPDSRNAYATNSAIDLTDYSKWITNLHCYNHSNNRLDKISSTSYHIWKTATNSPASWGYGNPTQALFTPHSADISSYKGNYYLQFHWLVNGGGWWCALLGNYLEGTTYSYENPF